MSTEKHKAIIREWTEAVNARDLNRIDELVDQYYTADTVYHHPRIPKREGREAIKQDTHEMLQRWESAPDGRIVSEDMLAEGDLVAGRYTFQKTDPETGQLIRNLHLYIIRFVDGQIAEEWEM